MSNVAKSDPERQDHWGILERGVTGSDDSGTGTDATGEPKTVIYMRNIHQIRLPAQSQQKQIPQQLGNILADDTIKYH